MQSQNLQNCSKCFVVKDKLHQFSSEMKCFQAQTVPVRIFINLELLYENSQINDLEADSLLGTGLMRNSRHCPSKLLTSNAKCY